MAAFQEEERKLRRLVASVNDYYGKPSDFPLDFLVNEIICPELELLLGKLATTIAKKHRLNDPDSQTLITHYTSIQTLVTILEDAQSRISNIPEPSYLRMYDSTHFNDPEEGIFFAKQLQEHCDWLEDYKVQHAYIASFILSSRSNGTGDDLLFWRTYGREGEGCALTMIPPKAGLAKVFYKTEELIDTVNILRPFLDLLNPLLEISNPDIRKQIKVILSKCVWKSLERLCYLYKNQAYKYENECRLIVLNSEIVDRDRIHIEYKYGIDSQPQLRHYYQHKDLQIEKLFTSGSSVTLGPCVGFKEDALNCIEILRDRAGLRHRTEIRSSEIPYRKS